MEDRPAYARVQTRLRGRARLGDDPQASTAFRWNVDPEALPAEAELVEAQVPRPLARWLIALGEKLDALLAMQSGCTLQESYPVSLDIREISGSGLGFRSEEGFMEGDILEVVLDLSDAPPRHAAATGRIVGSGPDGLWRLEFTTIREPDLEAVVHFVFQEEREQIRRRKWS